MCPAAERPPAEVPGPFSPQASDLCVACGLCCDGSVYAQASLDPDEVDAAAAEGLEVFERGGEAYFKLGCPCLKGTACQIYERRPRRCRSFRCVLLHRLDIGEISLPAALATAAEARRLADSADAINDRRESRSSARVRWHGQLSSLAAPDARDPANPAWLLAMTAFNLFLDRHFRKPHQRLIVEGATAPQDGERD